MANLNSLGFRIASVILALTLACVQCKREDGVTKFSARYIDVGGIYLEDTASKKMALDEAVNYCSGLGNGWRVPTKNELIYLWCIQPGLSVAGSAFSTDVYWSASEHSKLGGAYWCVGFDYGGTGMTFDSRISVRCVKDKEAFEKSKYPYVTTENGGVLIVLQDDEDGIDESNLFPARVTTTKTGNVFSVDNRMSRKFRVQKGQGIGLKTWNEAVSYCDNLDEEGCSDWRLPSQRELMLIWILGGSSAYSSGEKNDIGIGDCSYPFTSSYLYQQSGFTAFFTDEYWSATFCINYGFACYMSFHSGEMVCNYVSYGKAPSHYVRCIRDEW